MQGIKPIRPRLEHAAADLLGFVEPALLKQSDPLLHRLRDGGGIGAQVGLGHGRGDQGASARPRASARRAASRCSGRTCAVTIRNAVSRIAASSVKPSNGIMSGTTSNGSTK